MSTQENTNRLSLEKVPFWRRFWFPLVVVAAVGSFELMNWTTNVTSERILPQFATSAQIVIGRWVLFLGLGILFAWMLVTKQIVWQVKAALLGLSICLAAALKFSIREIENTGNNQYVIHWIWEQTQDERLAEYEKANSSGASVENKDSTFELDPLAPQLTDFLGSKRDGQVPGPTINAELLKTSNLNVLWRRPVGGGYASFVISGGLAVTIEQRGESEVVAALDLKTGKDVWTSAHPGHFKEDLGGNGPRATPTIAENQVFALGASGLLVCLDLASGKSQWETNILTDGSAENIQWGMCGAPLVVGDRVVVNPGGQLSNSGLIAYDRATGKKVWSSGKHRAGYASPVLATLCDIPQIVVFDADGPAGYQLDNGAELWRYEFKAFNGINVCQPLIVPENRVFVSAGYDTGAALIAVNHIDGKWNAEPLWKSKQMKCKMSSCVYLNGFIYGLDDGILACIDATSGKRKWKSGRYGHGQLIARDNLLIIQAENGELAIVAATPERHQEIAKLPMLEGGKTWNAPALAGKLLLLRNHFEAVLLELPTTTSPTVESTEFTQPARIFFADAASAQSMPVPLQ